MADISSLIGTRVRRAPREPREGVVHAIPVVSHVEDESGRRTTSGWSKGRNGYLSASFTTRRLPAGLFRFVPSESGVLLDPQPLVSDDTLMLPGSPVLEVLSEIGRFRSRRGEFVKRGLLHKRGVLLWGPPGSGKTCAIHLLIKMVVEDGGVACMIEHPGLAIEGLKALRKTEPQREIVAVMEDIDALVDTHGETPYLALLDGEVQVDNITFVATTNYPERMDARFLDRPSRFDLLMHVGMPGPEARRHYLQQKESGLGPAEIETMVAATEGMSIAHVKELVVLTRCLDVPMEKAVARLKQYKARRPSSTDFQEPFGFTK